MMASTKAAMIASVFIISSLPNNQCYLWTISYEDCSSIMASMLIVTLDINKFCSLGK